MKFSVLILFQKKLSKFFRSTFIIFRIVSIACLFVVVENTFLTLLLNSFGFSRFSASKFLWNMAFAFFCIMLHLFRKLLYLFQYVSLFVFFRFLQQFISLVHCSFNVFSHPFAWWTFCFFHNKRCMSIKNIFYNQLKMFSAVLTSRDDKTGNQSTLPKSLFICSGL